MRVLDVGSGAGDVAILLAQIVGPAGTVVGTDRSPEAIDVARTRVDALGLANVSFREGDPSELSFDQPFDAVVGRYVLQFVPEPSRFLGLLARHLLPSGVMVFHELDWNGARSWPPVPAYDACCRWCAMTIRAKGAATDLGMRLARVFAEAGLKVTGSRLESAFGSGLATEDVLRLVTDLMETLAADAARLNVATIEQIGLETLHSRIAGDIEIAQATVVGRAEIGIWSRLSATDA
jgi:SAM-dependent methyltransferase